MTVVAIIGFMTPNVFAIDSGMDLTVTSVQGSNIISVTGFTTNIDETISFVVVTPDATGLQDIDQVTPNYNCEFSTEFNTSNWNQNGMYSIKAIQGESLLYTVVLYVEVIDRMTLETNLKDKTYSEPTRPACTKISVDPSLTTSQFNEILDSTSTITTDKNA